MECYFDGYNQFYTIGVLILLGISLGANALTCAYWPKDNSEEIKEPFVTSSDYVEGDGDLEVGDDEIKAESLSINTSPHLSSVRRYTPIWGSSGGRSCTHRSQLPDWAKKEYLDESKLRRESLP